MPLRKVEQQDYGIKEGLVANTARISILALASEIHKSSQSDDIFEAFVIMSYIVAVIVSSALTGLSLPFT